MALKTVLGWLLNTELCTVKLQESRVLQLYKILAKLPNQKKRISKKIWYQVLGKVWSVVLKNPGGSGLFSALKQAITTVCYMQNTTHPSSTRQTGQIAFAHTRSSLTTG